MRGQAHRRRCDARRGSPQALVNLYQSLVVDDSRLFAAVNVLKELPPDGQPLPVQLVTDSGRVAALEPFELGLQLENDLRFDV